MNNNEILAFILSRKPCNEGKSWITKILSDKPEITPKELWDECLDIQVMDKSGKLVHARYDFIGDKHMTSVGRSFAAWLCLQLEIPCSTGTFSGREKVSTFSDGPAVGEIPFETVWAAFQKAMK